MHFEGTGDIYKASRLYETFARAPCTRCRKPRAITDMRERAEGEGSYVCYACASEEWPYECTACHVFKAASEFRAPRSNLERKLYRRCKGL